MDLEILKQLLEDQESEFLDFKREYHKNNSDLIHDILCLANSKTDNKYKYLIFGVDDDKYLFGIKNDIKRKRENDLMDLVKNAKLNNLPHIKLFNLNYQDKDIDIIRIENINYKPYFLTQDHVQGKDTIRAGVVYTRFGSTNTPKTSTASEKQIEEMYRERFSINKTPTEKLFVYLKDKENWKYNYINDLHLHFYYIPDPNYSMIVEEKEYDRDFFEPWNLIFPDQKCSKSTLIIKYNNVKIDDFVLLWCDGSRFCIPIPEFLSLKNNITSKDIDNKYISSYFYINDSLKSLCLEMIDYTYEQNGVNRISEFIKYFDSKEEANYKLNTDFNENRMDYIYFIQEHVNNLNKYYIQKKGKTSELINYYNSK